MMGWVRPCRHSQRNQQPLKGFEQKWNILLLRFLMGSAFFHGVATSILSRGFLFVLTIEPTLVI